MDPYYSDSHVTLYHGDCLELADLWTCADVLVTDPPYGETSLAWDAWPKLWPQFVADNSSTIRQLWSFGSTRMFLDHRDDFAGWKLAQDLVWSKPRGRSAVTDRFARSHEMLLHWYRGAWGDLYRETPTTAYHGIPHRGAVRLGSEDDGTKVKPMRGGVDYVESGRRLMLTVIEGSPGDPRTTLHPTQKPLNILEAVARYSCPPSGVITDPFAGSGSTLVAAKALGRKAIGVELEERYAEIAARRLSQDVLDFEERVVKS